MVRAGLRSIGTQRATVHGGPAVFGNVRAPGVGAARDSLPNCTECTPVQHCTAGLYAVRRPGFGVRRWYGVGWVRCRLRLSHGGTYSRFSPIRAPGVGVRSVYSRLVRTYGGTNGVRRDSSVGTERCTDGVRQVRRHRAVVRTVYGRFSTGTVGVRSVYGGFSTDRGVA